MRRGQFVIAAIRGEFGKPRPTLIVQSNLFSELASVVVCPLTTALRDDADLFRLTVEPSPSNGLRETSQVAIDKISVISFSRIGQTIGAADEGFMRRVNQALALFLEIN